MRIVIDSREQMPFDFAQYLDEVEVIGGKLDTGDYSLAGLESRVAVERKSMPDLISCLGVDRERFQRELQRAAALESFAVVVEGSWQDLASGNYRSKLNPAAAVASILAFTARLRIPFLFAGTRTNAEAVTLGFFQQYAKGKAAELKAISSALRK